MTEQLLSASVASPPPVLDSIINTLAEQGWVIDRSLFTPQDIALLRDECVQHWRQGEFHEAAIGQASEQRRLSEIRSDSVLWLDEDNAPPAVAAYFAKLEQIRQAVNQSLFMGLVELESHFAVFPTGAFYKNHLDRFRHDDARTLSAVLYLNQDWPDDAGGEMRLYLDPECQHHLDVAPEAGTLVLFLSDRFWHEVLPARQPRLSITGWFRRHTGNVPW
ncbi:2OG-Fe(II) oxygenase [Paludibacterium denitrificans]|uniref:2OG-Fe(II) oxygenase n=1 Tax=Paludibacterium denitrificans TaxID=2675226 RepID=A0A844GG83_9NEIS|nr:2OG-Fe(II) oxygenase [Paludibacterium denitrificans]MTD33515.1 2OG-Fe(II) oxygenase [Paludibacterium denitrificans]